MIKAAEIKAKAERKYTPFLQSVVEGKPYETVEIHCDKQLCRLKKYEQEIAGIRSLSKAGNGFGYSIRWRTVRNKSIGTQEQPKVIYFETETDFLKFIDKESETEQFRKDIDLILSAFPVLREWVHKFPRKVVEKAGKWPDLLKVLTYFKANPRPNLYIRELPIEVHTKFIEQSKGVLREMLDVVIADFANAEESDFEKRFSLRYKEPTVRLRILDKAIADYLLSGITDVSIPIGQLKTLAIPAAKVFVVENEVNFLTFPAVVGGLVVWGKGYAVADLKDVGFLRNAQVYYWGDLDAQGFEILWQFRGYFPQTRSFLMDAQTFKSFFECETGAESNINAAPNLTDEENALYQTIRRNNWRLEQEKIPQRYVEAALSELTAAV